MYNIHVNPDIASESEINGKGRLVKVRFSDKEVPNVLWFWIPTGNCHVCEHYVQAGAGTRPKCLNEDISHDEFFFKYVFTNDCPGYKAGRSSQDDLLDVMRAVKLVSGKPSQKVEVLVNEPWSIELALRAHREQETFMQFARIADDVSRGGVNDPLTYMSGGYTDLSDDLEGPPKMPPGVEEILRDLRSDTESQAPAAPASGTP